MRKTFMAITICCTCAIICIIATIYFHFFYPPTIEKIQIASFWVDLIIGIATVGSTIGAFVIAIKSPFWIQNANKTELQLVIKNDFPYRNKTIINEVRVRRRPKIDHDENGMTKLFWEKTEKEFHYPTFFYRLKIKNVTNKQALNVQLYLEHLRTKGSEQDLDNFLPMFLRWPYTQQIQSDKIIQGMGRYCDFFHICKSKKYLQFDCEENMATNDMINNTISEPGEYEITLLLGAENSKTIKRYLINLNYKQHWDSDNLDNNPCDIITNISIKEI